MNASSTPVVIRIELRAHAPFTALGTLSGILIMIALIIGEAPRSLSSQLFWIFHPLHVLLSAMVTAAMFRIHGGRGFRRTLWVGYLGSVGIATLSDCLIPFLAEWMLQMPNRGLHLGFIEKWWLVNPLALIGWTVTDAQGGSTRIRLTSLTKTTGLAPSLFVLKDPRPKNVGRAKS